MNPTHEPLWPYGTRGALVAALVILLFMTGVFAATRFYIGWPDGESIQFAALVAIGLSLLPSLFMLLDFAASRRAVLDIKGIKLDFSGVDIGRPDVRRESPLIPDNIGISGPIVSDTSPMNIIHTLEEATNSEIVVVNIKAGDAWWVTRLLALSAGAERVNSPRVFVFLGRKDNRDHQFLGWAEPREILRSILRSKAEYKQRYDKSIRIAGQVIIYGNNELLPQQPEPFQVHQDIFRYTNNPQFTGMGEAMREQVLMDQLASSYPGPSLEEPPDWLTLGRLNYLFGHCLNTEVIDLNWPDDKQIEALLETTSSYIALVKAGAYESMVRREDGDRLLLQQLFLQPQSRK